MAFRTSRPGRLHKRFAFGRNWKNFLAVIDDQRIQIAMHSLKTMLGVSDLKDLTFLDIGSGSGLFSLAALRLGAKYVVSFDYDPDSVACTAQLRGRYFAGATNWRVQQGSILDPDYMALVGQFDVVYAWGVLHHTGAMWTALANALIPTKPRGRLFVAIYNDQGRLSTVWHTLKRLYCSSRPGKYLVLATVVPCLLAARAIRDLSHGVSPLRRYSVRYSQANRGMSPLRDLVDWLGGYPFEVAKPQAIIDFYHSRGCELDRLKTTEGSGCNEFVFRKKADASMSDKALEVTLNQRLKPPLEGR